MRLALRNPRTGARDAWVEAIAPAEVADVVAALREAQPAWASAGVGARAEALLAWADVIAAERSALVAALVADTGRLHESHMEVDAVIRSLQRWASLAPGMLAAEERTTTSLPFVALQQANDPYGVVGVISPWNFPLLLSLIDAIPALAAGCAVLVKPSEITPRFIEPLQRTLDKIDALAPVCRYIAGAADVGAAVVGAVDAVCFTGSVPTGRAVAAAAAGRLVPAYCELGGKDPAVVLAGADIERTATALLWGSTANAGQSCQSIERVYVASQIHDELVDALVSKAKKVPLAYPEPSDGAIGPIIAERQIDVIAAHLTDARDKGATVRTGGELLDLGGGTYLRPTVLTEVDHSMLVMTAETFAPIAPIMAFDDLDAAVALANSTQYGLSAAVFGADEDAALAVAGRLQAGAVSINDAALTAVVHDGEKNAFRSSGLGGSRMGPAALRRFVRRRAFLVRDPVGSDPWWYDV